MTTLARFSERSIVWLIDAGDKDAIAALARRFARLKEDFPGAECHFLVREISLPLRLVMLAAGRPKAPYNVLVRIDMAAPLSPPQIAAVERMKAAIGGGCKVFLTSNTQFIRGEVEAGDVAMAFINTWPAHRSRLEAQHYWLHHHGPLVVSVGVPPVITSYSQVHFDISPDRPAVFDDTYQGLSFETIRGQGKLVKTFAAKPALRKLNKTLLADEKHFSGPPLFFAFRSQSM